MLSILYDVIVPKASTIFYYDHMTYITYYITSL